METTVHYPDNLSTTFRFQIGRLYCYTATDIIILCSKSSNKLTGIIVHTTGTYNHIGEYSDNWGSDSAIPFTGTVSLMEEWYSDYNKLKQ